MSKAQNTKEQATHPYVVSNARLVAKLPEPGTTWTANEENLGDEHITRLAKFRRLGIVTRVGKFLSGGDYRYRWETEEGPYQAACERVESETENALLPCGHSALSNKRGVDGITCGVCGKLHDKSEVNL